MVKNPAKVLESYIYGHGLTPTSFAKLIGASQGTVWRWVERWTLPSAKFAVAIEKKTGIPAESWGRARLDAQRGAA